MKSWVGLHDFPVIQNNSRPRFSSVERVSAGDTSHPSSQNVMSHVPIQEMLGRNNGVCNANTCVCSKSDGMVCSSLTEYTLGTFTVCNMLSSLYMC